MRGVRRFGRASSCLSSRRGRSRCSTGGRGGGPRRRRGGGGLRGGGRKGGGGVAVVSAPTTAVARELAAAAKKAGARFVTALVPIPFPELTRESFDAPEVDLFVSSRARDAFAAEESKFAGATTKVAQVQSKGR